MADLEQQRRSGAQAVERAVAVLHAFDCDSGQLTVSDIAERSGLPASTTHRIVTALVRGGMLERADPGSYAVGEAIATLAKRRGPEVDIDSAAPHLHALSATIGITASLGIADGPEAVTLYSARPPVRWCTMQIPDDRTALDVSAMGQAIVAFERSRTRSTRSTKSTVPVPVTSSGDAWQARRRGYVVSAPSQGVTAVAVPVFDDRGRVVASIGVQANSLRLRDDLITQITPIMRSTAGRLRDVVGGSTRTASPQII
ncbi:IclR family transcriptional regulator [Gordonia hongkongensis]|uniref:IclR family transcriptional regulator n=1 Tax=Gordonia hongkongensis TaxID=1701090 RepID=A0AAX3T597_9ACTN|nr:IclR family transcriptional regulator [Gordonia hongkongensis]QIK46645.1 IclR family transcriptional regulator [Gordonia terrae]WFP24351.1 IclR family transcriptional regulator [Gordonia hongkongensis]